MEFSTSNFNDLLNILKIHYVKMVKANLTTDTFEVFFCEDENLRVSCSPDSRLTDMGVKLLNSGVIHSDDKNNFTNFVNNINMRSKLMNGQDDLSLSYRRMINGEVHNITMNVLKSIEYTDQNQVVTILIKDMSDTGKSKTGKKKRYDDLTGLGTTLLFKEACKRIIDTEGDKPVGIVSVGMNTLKFTNEKYGATDGDELLKKLKFMIVGCFRPENSFRVGGDEFLIILNDNNITSFFAKVSEFVKIVQNSAIPIASIGYAYEEKGEMIEQIANEAKERMLKSKQEFYSQHPEYIM